jgi:hypothetical protein
MVALAVPQANSSPGLHALVIGVSHYPFADGPDATPQGASFGIRSLSSAARSASDVAAWLLEEDHHPALASLRILLSPVPGEPIHPTVAALLPGGGAPATRQAVEHDLGAFRQACRSHAENTAFVYMAGHGVQLNKRGAIVLLSDFGDPALLNELSGAIDVAGCHAGMNEAGNAEQQFWFADACRQVPAVARKFERLEGALTLSEGVGQVRSSPLFLASSTRENAFAEVGGTSLFSQALLWALRGAAAEGPDKDVCDDWYVGVTTLIRLLDARVKKLARAHEEEQTVDVTGRVKDAVVHRFKQPPDVDIEVVLRPEDAAAKVSGSLVPRGTGAGSPKAWAQWPFRDVVPPGIYELGVVTQPPLHELPPEFVNIKPPGFEQEIEVR